MVECEELADLRSGRFASVRQFVENADFGQGERTVQVTFFKKSDLAGVEAIEATDGSDLLGKRGSNGCGCQGGPPTETMVT